MRGNSNGKSVRKTGTAGAPTAPARRKGKKRFFFLQVLLFLVVCVALFMYCAKIGYSYTHDAEKIAASEIPAGDRVEIKISSGSSTVDIADLLKEEGFIKNIPFFRLLSKLVGFDGLYKAGRYNVSKDMNEYALMIVLTGEPLQNASEDIRIPEGMTVTELTDYLEKSGKIDRATFLNLLKKPLPAYSFMDGMKLPEGRTYAVEGYLYPDTYKMDTGWDEEALVLRLVDEFDRNFPQAWRDRAAELEMTVDEVVTLASIIELECLVPADYKKVSSVFHNRLDSTDMTLLQTDCSIQYARIQQGLGRTTTVLYSDLEIDSPYNTYKNAGLPPGPLCSPRSDAIEAALYPEATDFYYFFAAADGTNVYNKTLDGHTNDQRKFGVSGN